MNTKKKAGTDKFPSAPDAIVMFNRIFSDLGKDPDCVPRTLEAIDKVRKNELLFNAIVKEGNHDKGRT